MLNEDTLVSVYMPTKNRRKMLTRAVNSVFRQTYKNIELIIVDDASSDDTREYLERLMRSDKLVKVFFNEISGGACKARNTAIGAARGKYITGLDDDDEFASNHIEILYKNFSPSYSFLAPSAINDSAHGVNLRKKHLLSISLDKALHSNIVGNQVFTLTERMRNVGGFDSRYPAFQDYDLWVRLIERYGDAQKTMKKTYILHTDHEKNRITDNIEKRMEAIRLFVDTHKRHLNYAHLNSLELNRIMIKGERLRIITLMRLLNRDNFMIAISCYIRQRLPTRLAKVVRFGKQHLL